MRRPSRSPVWLAPLVAVFVVIGASSAPAGAATQQMADGALTVALSPSTGVTATTPVTITVSSPGGWKVNLCDSAIGSSVDLRGLIINCLEAGAIPGATGPFTFTQPVFQVLGSGRTVDCTASPTSCVVVVFPAGQTVPQGPFAMAPISFGVQPLAAQPSTSLTDGQSIQVYVTGTPLAVQQVAQCVLPAGAGLLSSTCGTPVNVSIPAAGGEGSVSFTVTRVLSGGSGVVDCAAVSCGLASFDSSGTLLASIPLGIDPTPKLSLSPTTDLLDGDALTLSATGLLASQSAFPEQCIGTGATRHCELDFTQPLTPGPDGTISATVHATQRFAPASGSFAYCRLDNCSYGFLVSGGGPQPEPIAYSLAAGSVIASPSSGLSDGQGVTLTGTGLMPTYLGRSFGPFPSGGWATAECDASIGTSPSLYQVFQYCGFPGNASMVAIPGSTMTTTVAPHASLTAVLGATTDCAASPGACVIGLVRFEQDGSMSTHLEPLTFG